MAREDERLNRTFWETTSAEYQTEHADELEAAPLAWGTWRIPESEVGALGDLAGLDVLELGCGGGQWSIALARLGVRVTRVSPSMALTMPLATSDGRSAFAPHGVTIVPKMIPMAPTAQTSCRRGWRWPWPERESTPRSPPRS